MGKKAMDNKAIITRINDGELWVRVPFKTAADARLTQGTYKWATGPGQGSSVYSIEDLKAQKRQPEFVWGQL